MTECYYNISVGVPCPTDDVEFSFKYCTNIPSLLGDFSIYYVDYYMMLIWFMYDLCCCLWENKHFLIPG